MAMEIPVLHKYFDNIVEVKDARLRNQCTMECEFCDCTRNIKLPGKSLVDKLGISKKQLAKDGKNNNDYIDIGRLKLNRKKQIAGIEGLRSISDKSNSHSTNLIPKFA
jgi:hypothetical protein